MSPAPISSDDLRRYGRRVSDLTRFRPEHVDLLFDRANDNAVPERHGGIRQAPEPRQPLWLNP
jgi:hypothetical protein